MASCYMLPLNNASDIVDSRYSSHPLFTTFYGDVWSVELRHWKDPPITSAVWQGREKLIMVTTRHCFPLSVSFTHVCVLRFLPTLSFYHLASTLIVIVSFNPRHCCVFHFFFSWCVLLPTLSYVIFLYLIIARLCLPKCFIPCGSPRACNLHYPTCSFYPLITFSVQLALVVYPLHELTQTPLSPPNL